MSDQRWVMHIVVKEPMKGWWVAIDQDTYDGTNDFGGGKTKWSAIRELIDILEEREDEYNAQLKEQSERDPDEQ